MKKIYIYLIPVYRLSLIIIINNGKFENLIKSIYINRVCVIIHIFMKYTCHAIFIIVIIESTLCINIII